MSALERLLLYLESSVLSTMTGLELQIVLLLIIVLLLAAGAAGAAILFVCRAIGALIGVLTTKTCRACRSRVPVAAMKCRYCGIALDL